MGRGGGRSKASSTGTTHEAGTPYIPIDLNTTLIEFILSGHFETDYFSYCSTRLSAYTCRYWFDPNHSASQADFDTHAFEEGALRPIETHSDMLMHFANPAHFPVSLAGGIVRDGWDKHPNDSTLLINDLLPLTISREKQICSTLLCIALFVSILANMLSCHCLRRISDGGLYIAKILQYLTILECIDLFIQLGNTLIDFYRGVPLFTVIDFIGKWSCQTLAMGYTSLAHSEGLLVSALAGYSLLFLKNLRYHLARFRGDWTFNFLMLVIALTATASSQFFYTFDLFHVDNRLPPSKAKIGKGVFVEPSLYMCGFSASWGLSHVYVSYIWPMIDHLQGDIIPCLMSLAAGTMILISRQSVARKERKEQDLGTTDEMNEFIWILPLLFLLHGFSILPRTIFFVGKYFVFSGKIFDNWK
ncbi:unnamed protein product [Rodentolepis nana]|uniref:GpcrRhopsn4 domain-containing protein n=1 Tax=Rodentolepis nana TaxID=102285 RepID=A0A0R3TA80_RODNA|nr:unnamed protein product [Rodentolepis nana]